MYHYSVLRRVEELCNNAPCPFCGQNHSVSFNVCGEVLSYNSSINICDGFRKHIVTLLQTENNRWMNDLLDMRPYRR